MENTHLALLGWYIKKIEKEGDTKEAKAFFEILEKDPETMVNIVLKNIPDDTITASFETGQIVIGISSQEFAKNIVNGLREHFLKK